MKTTINNETIKNPNINTTVKNIQWYSFAFTAGIVVAVTIGTFLDVMIGG